MEKETIDFQLSDVLEYSHKGDFQKTATIIMHAPSPEIFTQVCNLSQLVMGAFTDAQRLRGDVTNEDKDVAAAREKIEDDGMSAEEIKVILFASQNVPFIKIAEEFEKLAGKVCEVAEGVKLTSTLIAKMGIGDHINLVCTYIANFIAPSLL